MLINILVPWWVTDFGIVSNLLQSPQSTSLLKMQLGQPRSPQAKGLQLFFNSFAQDSVLQNLLKEV
ncbi:MAG: hypothetical protein LH679_24300 [Cyanobacteria bacterium CAN_BIN43]|nr:hypothetical protein [Cyanobacteria bacterium CAN_BIN43]